ncbi:MAG: cysteine desulfurase DndA [Cycloclasticus sp.]|nr:MAG: cysteine desulfurase DndA [Cycloclasticus sp.]
MTIYLDCNATTPMDADVAKLVQYYLREEFGNSGSRTHEYGLKAKSAVEKARLQVADVVGAQKDEVVFTSGATESNNIAILGLAEFLKSEGKNHIITTAIEHKAVLEPCAFLDSQGFSVTYLQPDAKGGVSVDQVFNAITDKTGLISMMHVNNETGVILPIDEIANNLLGTEIYFHVDAAQGFGKLLKPLKNERIDLISISAHKVHGPKGVGALITRRKKYKKPPLKPLMYGGGQEKGLRPGTLPVALIAGLGLASELAERNHESWLNHCENIRAEAVSAFESLGGKVNGKNALPNVLNISIPDISSEAAIVVLKELVAISNGSACTSSSYTPSHVLEAMGLDEAEIRQAIRISWCHKTGTIPWSKIVKRLQSLL